MAVIGFLELQVLREGSLEENLVPGLQCLEQFELDYELFPQGILLEADDPGPLFEAARAMHDAFGDQRVITRLKVDATPPEQSSYRQELIDMA